VREALVTRLIHYFNVYRGGDSDELRPDYYTHIVNDRNFSRLSNLLDNTKGKLVYGGVRDVETRFFYPAIVVNVQPDDSLMSEEIFGPILPIIDADLDTAIDFTAAGEHPLALYAFTQSSEEKKRILDSTNSGGVTFNDCMLHAAAYDAPFGGVGTSGFGSYHGRYGIYAFTHLRTCLEGFPSWMDKALDFRFPPYTEDKVKKLDRRAAGFDMDGNDKRGASEWIKWVVGLAFAGTAWILRR
jgi:acyl-CoA reductase-like NAD-dependent aldehyde dehydrogenase